MSPELRLLTIDEAAALLRISARTLKRWCRERRVSYIGGAKAIRFMEADVDAAIQSQREPGGPQRRADLLASESARQAASNRRRKRNKPAADATSRGA